MRIRTVIRELYRPVVVILGLVGCLFLSALFLRSLDGRLAWLYQNQAWLLVPAFLGLTAVYIPQLKSWRVGDLRGELVEAVKIRGRSRRKITAKFFRNWRGVMGSVIFLVFLVLALFPSIFVPQELPTYHWLEFREMDLGPSRDHLLGVTHNGGDVWTIVVQGARPVMLFGLQAATIAIVMGGVIGALTGYMGGLIDRAFSMLVETILAFPSLFMIITILTITRSMDDRLWLISLIGVVTIAKVVRAETLSIRTHEYVAASRANGCSDLQTVFNHILVNAVPVLLIQASLFAGQAILLDACIDFLGVDGARGAAGWAGSLSASFNQFRSLAFYREPWLVASTGTALMLLIASFNLIGDALRDALDNRGGA